MSAVESSREENAYLAKLAEQTERYEEMVEFMEKVMKTLNGEELTVEERNLLSVAYKKVIEARRDSWRIISSIEQKEETRGNEDHVSLIKEYRGKVEAELSKICDGILKLLNSHLVPSASSAESTVFYLKMKGDYHRCLAEFKTGAERKEAAENTLLAYKSAQDIALADLASTHPITFGLALNISDFYDEILNSPDRACSLAKQIQVKESKGAEDVREMYMAAGLWKKILSFIFIKVSAKGTSSRSSKMSAVESSREENAYLAKLAEQTERYEEMVEFMEKVMKTLNGEELTVEERNLLSVAYKKVIGARRDSWRIISSIEQKEETRGNEDHVFLIKEYRGKVEAELSKICDGILKLLDSHLVPSASSAESKVFYLTMKGDYHRYLAEFKTGAERKEAAKNTLLAYKSAQDIALADLASTHPIRLGLALNFSDFYYEILNSPDRACSLAKQAFDEAISELDTLGEESYKDSTLIMKRLRDNLTLWISDITEDGADEIKEATKKESGEDQRLND